MLIGYARVSTHEQNLDLQEDALKAAGCKKVYTDKTGGTKAERPGLENALANVRPGDSRGGPDTVPVSGWRSHTRLGMATGVPGSRSLMWASRRFATRTTQFYSSTYFSQA